MADWMGIDLQGRSMLHPPWQKGRCCGRYAVPVETINEIVTAFEQEGGSGDELLELLNRHMPKKAGKLDRNEIANPQNSFSLEFQFYTVQFTKKLLGDQLFCYKTEGDGQLSVHHVIYEKGRMDFPPWITADGNDYDGYISITNLSAILSWVEEVYSCDYIEMEREALGRRITAEFIQFMNLSVPEKYKVDRNFINKEGIIVSWEYLSFAGSILRDLTNEAKLLSKSYYYSFHHHNLLAKAIFLQPEFSPVEGFTQWINRTNNIHRMEFSTGRRKFRVRLNFDSLINSGMCSRYVKSSLAKIREGAPVVHQVFLELATGKKVKMKLIYDENDLSECTIILRWRPPQSSTFIPVAAGLSAAFAAAIVLLGRLFFSHQTSFYILSGLFVAFSGGAAAILLTLRSKLEAVRNRFRASRTVLDKQLDSLKETTNELLSERNLLDNKVRERTAELNDALEQLKELDRSKTNFIANVSHELRTPLTLLSVPIEGVKNGRYGKTIRSEHPVFSLLERNVDRLKNQINQLLDFSRLDLGTMPFEPRNIDIVDYCRSLTAELESLAEKKGLYLRMSNMTEADKQFISADERLLETAILNLLNNALKFTDSGGVLIVLSRIAGTGTLELRVEDTGIGFPIEQKSRLFQRFAQAEEDKERRREGAGLGLSLVDEIVKRHGWEIDAESRPGKGSAFIITMPLVSHAVSKGGGGLLLPEERPARYEIAGAGLYSRNGSQPENYSRERDSILIVEDNPDMGTVLQDLLESDYNIKRCTGGADALEWLETSPQLSLIICDVMMPGMSGFSFREELMKIRTYCKLPFIYLTALADPLEKVEGLKSGAVDYIQKPFSAAELLLKIRNNIESHNAVYRRAVRDLSGVERLNRMTVGVNSDAGPDWLRYGITGAERRIIDQLRLGLQDKEIAASLSISPRTVSSHLSHIYQKTDTQNRTELITLLYK